MKSPGKESQKMTDLIGKKAIRDINKDEFFFPSDIEQKINKFSKYNFNRDFGIPVRYHDLNKLAEKSNFDFVESSQSW